MCYYDCIIYTCQDWKWGNFRQHCNREYRMGETCGLRLVNQNIQMNECCKICDKIGAKCRRRQAEVERLQLWSNEGRLQSLKSSVQKCYDLIAQLDEEIQELYKEKEARYKAVSGFHRSGGS